MQFNNNDTTNHNRKSKYLEFNITFGHTNRVLVASRTSDRE